jgi:acetyl-CoA synthetase
MNLGGIKTSSAEIEQCLLNTPEIKELAAIGQPDSSGGPDQLIIFAVTETMQETDSLKKLLQQQLKKNLNPLFKIQQLILLPSLPKTSSNKIIRKQLKHLLVEELSND